jgi:hypothetical protein
LFQYVACFIAIWSYAFQDKSPLHFIFQSVLGVSGDCSDACRALSDKLSTCELTNVDLQNQLAALQQEHAIQSRQLQQAHDKTELLETHLQSVRGPAPPRLRNIIGPLPELSKEKLRQRLVDFQTRNEWQRTRILHLQSQVTAAHADINRLCSENNNLHCSIRNMLASPVRSEQSTSASESASDSDPDCIVNEVPAAAADVQDLLHSRRHVSLPTFGFILPNSVDAAWSEQDNKQVLVFRDGIISRSTCINDKYWFDRDRVLPVRMRFETLPRKQPRKRHSLAPRAWSYDALDLYATPA